MKRVFVYDGREIQDPDPKMTPDEVRQYYVQYYPELSNAEIKESKRKVPEATVNGVVIPEHQDDIYEFKKRVGTKGDGAINVGRLEAEATYEVRPVVPADWDKRPIGVFRNGAIAQIFENEAAANDELENIKKENLLRSALEAFVEGMAKKLDMADTEIWYTITGMAPWKAQE